MCVWGWGGGCPCLPGHLGDSPELFWSPCWCCPRGSWLSPLCALTVLLGIPQPGDISLEACFSNPGSPKPLLLLDPRGQGTELGYVFFLGQVNGWDMTMVTHDQARKRLTKRSEEVVRLLVTRQSLQKAVQQSMLS